MADENVDLRFLGRQVQTVQVDVRELRAGHLRLESDVVGLRAEIDRLRGDVDARFESVDARLASLESELRAGFKAVDTKFEQVNQTMATNLQAILAAINK